MQQLLQGSQFFFLMPESYCQYQQPKKGSPTQKSQYFADAGIASATIPKITRFKIILGSVVTVKPLFYSIQLLNNVI
jgi:hypothetical protein